MHMHKAIKGDREKRQETILFAIIAMVLSVALME
jgi:hypothetical protein